MVIVVNIISDKRHYVSDSTQSLKIMFLYKTAITNKLCYL